MRIVDSTQQLVRKPPSTIVVMPLLRRMKSRFVLANVSSPRLPSIDDVAVLRREVVDDGGAPGALDEGVAVDDALEDAVGVGADLVVALGERDRRVHDRDAGLPGRLDHLLRVASMSVLSMTSSTAPWSTPPSEVKSFWYSMRTTAVLDGSMGMASSWWVVHPNGAAASPGVQGVSPGRNGHHEAMAVTEADMHAAALALPRDLQKPSYGTPGFRVKDKLFARIREEGDVLALWCSDVDEKAALIASEPDKFFTTPHYDGHAMVLVRFGAIDRDELGELLTESWRLRPPSGCSPNSMLHWSHEEACGLRNRRPSRRRPRTRPDHVDRRRARRLRRVRGRSRRADGRGSGQARRRARRALLTGFRPAARAALATALREMGEDPGA